MRRLANLGFGLVLGLALVTLSGGQTHARNSKHPAALPALNINSEEWRAAVAKDEDALKQFKTLEKQVATAQIKITSRTWQPIIAPN